MPEPTEDSFENPHEWGLLTTNIGIASRPPTKHHIYIHETWCDTSSDAAHIFLYEDDEGNRYVELRETGPIRLPAPDQERYPDVMCPDWATRPFDHRRLLQEVTKMSWFLVVVPFVTFKVTRWFLTRK